MNRGATLGKRAELTIEVVQQGLLKHSAHEWLHMVRLQPRSQGDGDHRPAPARGQERHMNTQTDQQMTEARGREEDRSPLSGLQAELSYPRGRVSIRSLGLLTD